MYQTIKINDWILEIDVEETKKQYLKKWALCDCLYCLNFYEAMKSRSEIELQFFNRLGINPSQCNHLSHFDPQENGLYFYIGCYHMVGKVSNKTPLEIINSDGAIEISNNLHIGFSNDLEFVPGGFTRPVLQLDFEIEVPWVLVEKPN
ncbi:hypothetical protein [Priestia megaterium]|uniref:hypothetical protein n=1 Tax=Priestia megaterium TaxID=1404 RepID=UPI00263BC1FE|nr:hypothetical protein [Priestia megaterium]MCF6795732.1 hypothetical protein [Bacillus sp. ET1]MDN4861894.1 hypothetical protein [Priestia megaterium]MED3830783.1 hypothetical protein [Priestia megaterium]MED4181483.1 hypothetical protein [Priestia megaterium]